MKFKSLFPVFVGLIWGNTVLADSQLEINPVYEIKLLDGQKVSGRLLENKWNGTLTDGKHQLVIAFKGNYSTSNNTNIVKGEPLVLNFESHDGQIVVLDFKQPRSKDEAERFAKVQEVQLKDKVTDQLIPSERFIMPKVNGFQFSRNYQQELVSMGKAFNPTKAALSNNAVTEGDI